MQINKIQPKQYKNKYNNNHTNPNFKGAREVLKAFANPDNLATTLAIETCVTTGRSVNAYKRGGKHEFRESLLDNITSAVFWIFGVDMFNKIGDKIGGKYLKLPMTNFDVGKDALRDPFKNVAKKMEETVSDPEKAKALTKKLEKFKFSKIVVSSLLATGFVGFVLPKINQHITRSLFSKNKMNNILNEENKTTSSNKYSMLKSTNFEDFDRTIKNQKTPSFKGGIATFANALENNRICKLLTSDAGMLTGRVTTARNKDEALEYAFRDTLSPIFYYASTPIIYKGLQKLTKSTGLTSIDAVAAKQINDVVTTQLNGGKMSTEEFAKKTIGVLSESSKKLLEQLPFKEDVISIKDLTGKIDDNLMQKALKMANLQPETAGIGKVLTKQQVADVLKDGVLNTAEFMNNIYGQKFGENLTNPYKFIPMKKITNFRNEIDGYVNNIINVANKKNGGMVDAKFLKKMNRKGFAMSAGFRVFAMAVSALFLGIIIPKAQYAMTARRTGSTTAPGLREFADENNKKA